MKNKRPRIMFFRGLAFRYSIFFLVSILIIIFIPMGIGYGLSIGLLFTNAQTEANILTRQTVTRLENAIQPIELVPKTLVQAMENPNISYNEVIRIARDFVRHDTNVFGTALAFEPYTGSQGEYWFAPYAYENEGKMYSRMLGGKEYDYFKMDWYRIPKLLNKPVWTEPYFDKGGGDTLMCTYSTPFYREAGGKRIFAGVLTMDVSLAGFNQIVSNINIFDSGYGILISRKGRVIASPKTGLLNADLPEYVIAKGGENTIHSVRKMMEGKSGFSEMDGLEARKHPSFLSYAPVSITGWSFGILFPKDELLKDLFDFLKVISWILGISVFILLLTTVFLTRRMTRPLVRLAEATHKIGHGDFNVRLPVRKSKDEIAQLTQAFSVMQDELRTYVRNLEETTVAKEKIESELKVAQSIQMGMLPRGLQTPDNWELFATIDPAKAVGGDLYDFFYLDERHLCIAIGDVAGKGVPASLFMMVTRTLLRAKANAKLPLNMLMSGINNELCRENPNQMFVTFFAGIVDLETGIMEFCNAGHNNPYILRQGGVLHQIRERNGIPLGIFENTEYTTSSYTFHSQEILVMTTDGVTDAVNLSNDFFGEAQLARSLATMTTRDARSITELLIAEVQRFSTGMEQADDITILALQYKQNIR